MIPERKDDWRIFPKDGSGDSHPDFPKDADIDLKDVDKILLINGRLKKHWKYVLQIPELGDGH